MPFTLSHPAAVLPFRRWLPRLPFSALVIGSMAPDFPYFILSQTEFHKFGHTLPGLFEFDIPAGLFIYILWHALLKAPLATLLPDNHRLRVAPLALRPVAFRSLSFMIAVLFALLLGTLTHLLWDSCTHANGLIVRHLPILTTPLLPIPLPVVRRFPLYNAMQHASTVIGLVILFYAYRQWYSSASIDDAAAARLPPASGRTKRTLLAAILLAAPIAGAAGSYWGAHNALHIDFPKKRVSEAIESAMTSTALILLMFTVNWHRNRDKSPLSEGMVQFRRE